MLKRKIQTEISDYLDNGSDKILVLDGARQIGKSFIIRYEGQKRFCFRFFPSRLNRGKTTMSTLRWMPLSQLPTTTSNKLL